MEKEEQPIGTVFISYSHDSPDHAKAVLALSNRLRSEGIDCVLDQYNESPPEGWPRWMDREIRRAEFVLMICTMNYYNRVMDLELEGVGLGIKWEGNLIYQHLYNSGSVNTKFVPAIFKAADLQFVPTPLQGTTIYNLESINDYDKLYYRLIGKPFVEKPPLGKRRPLPEKEVKTDVAMYLSIPIDVDLWNKARWKATYFLFFRDKAPILGLAFQNEEAAKEIFNGWRRRFGDHDKDEELRISIIEGDISGKEPGYSVHVGADPDNLIPKYKKHGFDVKKDILLLVSRIHRMTPTMPARNLEIFKDAYKYFKSYILAPGVVDEDGKNLKPLLDLGIHKNKIIFREVKDIGPNDIDIVVIKS